MVIFADTHSIFLIKMLAQSAGAIACFLHDGICCKWPAWARGEAPDFKGPSHKKEESTKSKTQRARYPKQRAGQWGHLHDGEKLPTGQYSGERGRGQELPTERDGVKA
jgi:hypothetical protein